MTAKVRSELFRVEGRSSSRQCKVTLALAYITLAAAPCLRWLAVRRHILGGGVVLVGSHLRDQAHRSVLLPRRHATLLYDCMTFTSQRSMFQRSSQ